MFKNDHYQEKFTILRRGHSADPDRKFGRLPNSNVFFPPMRRCILSVRDAEVITGGDDDEEDSESI